MASRSDSSVDLDGIHGGHLTDRAKPGLFRRVVRRTLSPAVRDLLRTFLREVPIRLRDLPADLTSATGLPPARLRRRVSGTSSRAEFLAAGQRATASLLDAYGKIDAQPGRPSVLDFGCGCGRVARHLLERFPEIAFAGVDVDADAIAWCTANLRGDYRTIAPAPPIPFEDSSFDVVYVVSVFTHLDETGQDAWLAELHRLLRPDGVLLASTHSPILTFERPDLSEAQHRTLQETGFLFAPSPGDFNSQSAFHSLEYLQRHWSRWFDLVAHQTYGLAGYQDLGVFRRRA